MKTFIFNIMLNGIFVCTLKYKYCPLFPIDAEDLTKFVLKKRPTLKGKDFRIVFQIWQDLKKAKSTKQLMPSKEIVQGAALINMVAPQIYLSLVEKDIFTKRLKKVTMKEFKIIVTSITYLLIGALEAHCYYLFRADAIIALAVITLLGFVITFGIVVIKEN